MLQKSELFRYISGRKNILKEIIFYGGVILYLFFLYYQLQDVPQRDQIIPRYVILGTFVLCLMGLIVTFIIHVVKPAIVQETFPHYYPDQDVSQENRSEQPDNLVSEKDELTSKIFPGFSDWLSSTIFSTSFEDFVELKSAQKALHFTTPLIYMILIPTLGFFSSTFIFAFIHSKLSNRSTSRSFIFALILTSALWTLFIEILGRRVILSVGILI